MPQKEGSSQSCLSGRIDVTTTARIITIFLTCLFCFRLLLLPFLPLLLKINNAIKHLCHFHAGHWTGVIKMSKACCPRLFSDLWDGGQWQRSANQMTVSCSRPSELQMTFGFFFGSMQVHRERGIILLLESQDESLLMVTCGHLEGEEGLTYSRCGLSHPLISKGSAPGLWRDQMETGLEQGVEWLSSGSS